MRGCLRRHGKGGKLHHPQSLLFIVALEHKFVTKASNRDARKKEFYPQNSRSKRHGIRNFQPRISYPNKQYIQRLSNPLLEASLLFYLDCQQFPIFPVHAHPSKLSYTAREIQFFPNSRIGTVTISHYTIFLGANRPRIGSDFRRPSVSSYE